MLKICFWTPESESTSFSHIFIVRAYLQTSSTNVGNNMLGTYFDYICTSDLLGKIHIAWINNYSHLSLVPVSTFPLIGAVTPLIRLLLTGTAKLLWGEGTHIETKDKSCLNHV